MQDALGERIELVGFDQESGDLIAADLGGAVEVECDHRSTGGHRLGQGTGETFASGEMNQHVHEGEVTGDFMGWDKAGEDEMAGQRPGLDGGLKPGAPGSVADEEKPGVRAAGDDSRGDGEEIVMSLPGEQARDFADDDVGGVETEL